MFANRNWLAIALAIMVAIGAVIIANSYLTGAEQRDAAAAEENRMVQIAVARVPLVYGTALTAENIRMVSWPVTSLPQGAFQSTKDLIGSADARVAIRPIEAGEPILPGKITGPGGRASISTLIEPDMRAVAVRINDVAGVAGFVLPGDSVDILITRAPPEAEGGGSVGQITDLLLQNVRVIAIDQNANESDNATVVGKTVTLSVDQLGAQKLALGGQTGSLSLALRNAENQESNPALTVSTEDLRDGAYGGNYRGSSYASSSSEFPAASYSRPRMTRVRRSTSRAKPKISPTVTVQVVRGTESSDYQVKRYAGY